MILSQSLRNKSLIVTSDSRPMFNDSLFKKGVAFVNDLIDYYWDLIDYYWDKILGSSVGRKETELMVWHFKCSSKGMENFSKKLL